MKNNKSLIAPGASRALVSKIARLPADIRQQINHRLFNGRLGSEILSWLNDLPAVKEILAAQFDGQPINSQNLSNWRASGYRQWFANRQDLDEIKDISLFAADAARDGASSISHGAATVASVQMLKLLRGAADAGTAPEDIVKYSHATASLHKAELSNARIGLTKEKIRQRDEHLLIIRDKNQRDCAHVALRVLGDARAQAIEASDCSLLEKLELIGRHLFGPLWVSRPLPVKAASPENHLAHEP